MKTSNFIQRGVLAAILGTSALNASAQTPPVSGAEYATRSPASPQLDKITADLATAQRLSEVGPATARGTAAALQADRVLDFPALTQKLASALKAANTNAQAGFVPVFRRMQRELSNAIANAQRAPGRLSITSTTNGGVNVNWQNPTPFVLTATGVRDSSAVGVDGEINVNGNPIVSLPGTTNRLVTDFNMASSTNRFFELQNPQFMMQKNLDALRKIVARFEPGVAPTMAEYNERHTPYTDAFRQLLTDIRNGAMRLNDLAGGNRGELLRVLRDEVFPYPLNAARLEVALEDHGALTMQLDLRALFDQELLDVEIWAANPIYQGPTLGIDYASTPDHVNLTVSNDRDFNYVVIETKDATGLEGGFGGNQPILVDSTQRVVRAGAEEEILVTKPTALGQHFYTVSYADVPLEVTTLRYLVNPGVQSPNAHREPASESAPKNYVERLEL